MNYEATGRNIGRRESGEKWVHFQWVTGEGKVVGGYLKLEN